MNHVSCPSCRFILDNGYLRLRLCSKCLKEEREKDEADRKEEIHKQLTSLVNRCVYGSYQDVCMRYREVNYRTEDKGRGICDWDVEEPCLPCQVKQAIDNQLRYQIALGSCSCDVSNFRGVKHKCGYCINKEYEEIKRLHSQDNVDSETRNPLCNMKREVEEESVKGGVIRIIRNITICIVIFISIIAFY